MKNNKKFPLSKMNRRKLLIGFLFLALGVFIALGEISWGSIVPSARRTVTVTGYAEEDQQNQVARFSATVTANDADKENAVATATEDSDKLIEALKDFGISDKDLKTQSINLYQEQESYFEGGVSKFQLGKWIASYTVEIVLRDVEKAPELTTLLTQLNTSNIWGPDFTVDAQTTNNSSLMTKAYEDAQLRAQTLAQASGKRLGPVISIAESYSSPSYYGMERGGGGGGYSPGATSLYGAVTVTFELR